MLAENFKLCTSSRSRTCINIWIEVPRTKRRDGTKERNRKSTQGVRPHWHHVISNIGSHTDPRYCRSEFISKLLHIEFVGALLLFASLHQVAMKKVVVGAFMKKNLKKALLVHCLHAPRNESAIVTCHHHCTLDVLACLTAFMCVVCFPCNLIEISDLVHVALQIKRQNQKKATTAQMDLANKAICYAMRNPPAGHKKMPYKDIQKMVRKTDGSKPQIAAICQAAQNFKKEKKARGRPVGSYKTSKDEDRKLMQTFHKIRPPGHGVTSRELHNALPRKISMKVCRRTLRRRLAKKGYVPEKKSSKHDPGTAGIKRRVKFGKYYQTRTAATWKEKLHGCGDFKEFTWYPKALYSKFARLRAPWTYMTKAEKQLPAFQRPKRWFPKKEYNKTKKTKVFSLTTSNGKSIAFLCPSPWDASVWAGLVRSKVGPFLKRSFPGTTSFQLLLDAEKLLHTPTTKNAYNDFNITTLPHWPKYSPDLNPQENVWSWAEKKLRELESGSVAFPAWQRLCVKAVKEYPAKSKLVGSMAKRVKLLLDRRGAMIPM